MLPPLFRHRRIGKTRPHFFYFFERVTFQRLAPLADTDDAQAQVLKDGFVNTFRAIPHDDACVSLKSGYSRVLLPLRNQLSQLATDLRVLTVIAVEGDGGFILARRFDDRLVRDCDSGGGYRAAGGAQPDEGFGFQCTFGNDNW